MLLLSPWARPNTVDSRTMSTDAILRFIEDRFAGGQRIASGSLDNVAGSVNSAFQSSTPHLTPLVLSPSTGEPR
jgi:phospholipase C